MSLPKEPRQKMINLMYLVLTALLALNVSSEIINAFVTINNSLISANGVIETKNNSVYQTFEKKLNEAQTKAQAAVWQVPAFEAKRLSKEVYDYLETVKIELKKASDLKTENGTETYKQDDLDAATRLLVEGPKGEELLNKLTTYKQNLIDVLNPNKFNGQSSEIIKKLNDAIAAFRTSLPLDLTPAKSTSSHGEVSSNKPWQSGYFRMTPTVAAITMLSKLQNDVKNSESQVADFCLKQVGAVEIVYDNFQAIASQSSEYLMPGQELTIKAGIGAFSKQAAPTVSIGGSIIPLNAEGVAEQKIKVGNTGTYTSMVNISFKKPDGTIGTTQKEIKYTVGSPTGLFASATEVNVLYNGISNPVAIAGGSGDEKISPSIDNGTIIKKGGGMYEVNPASTGKARISATVDGKTTTFEFPVRRIPNPTPAVGQYFGGSIPVNQFKANVGIRADMGEFVFKSVKFNVIGYTIVCTGKGFENGPKYAAVQGNAYFTPEVKGYIEMCRPGSSVLITDISVSGPDGTRKLPGSLAFNLTN